MEIIKVKKKNEVYLKISADAGIMSEISDFFTFEVPGAKFTPLYRSRMWDGKIRLMNVMVGELYVGLLEHLRYFAKQNNYEIDLSEYPLPNYNYTVDVISQFCNKLNVASAGNPISIREYQIDAVHKAISDDRRLLLSPTGSGKSLILYSLVRWHNNKGRKQLIIVPTTSLVSQMYSDFKDYSSINGWDVDSLCVKIQGGLEKRNDAQVVISTWQSIYKLPKSFFEEFDVVYGDEAHLFKAKSLTDILNKCVNTKYRIGTTGTLDGTKTNKLILEGVFGPVYKVTSTKNLIENKQLADLKIFCLLLQYTEEERKLMKKKTYQEEIDFLVSNQRRNKFIKNLALTQKGNTLVLFQYVEKHGHALFEMIKEAAHENRKIFYVHGGTDSDQRESIRHIVEKESDAIIVASFGTFSTGVNIKNLHNVIFASPSKSRVRNLQSIGRGLRTSGTKNSCNLYDIGDDLSWKTSKNYTLTHMAERIKIYAEEQFDYKIVKVDV